MALSRQRGSKRPPRSRQFRKAVRQAGTQPPLDKRGRGLSIAPCRTSPGFRHRAVQHGGKLLQDDALSFGRHGRTEAANVQTAAETIRKVGVKRLVETGVVPSAQLQRSLARGCRSLRRFEPSTSCALPAVTSASADSRPSGDVAAIARCFRSAPSILAPRRDAPPRSR